MRAAGIVRVQLVDEDVAGDVAFDAREERARDAEHGGRDAAARAGMHALRQYLDARSPTRFPRSEVVHQSCS